MKTLGTVFPHSIRFQIIDVNSMKWRTIGTAMDTPNAIRGKLSKLRAANPDTTIWVYSPINGRHVPD